MDNFTTDVLRKIALAPYIQIATALIGKARKIGGNQFRHNWATLGILIDHKIINPLILKAGVIHDLKEDAPECFFPDKICLIDCDGPRVVELVEELSIRDNETKIEYLERVMVDGSEEAKIIKLADRISNLIDIQLGTFDIHHIIRTLDETKKYILPYAKGINENLYLEMFDLITLSTKYMQRTIELIANKIINKVRDMILELENRAEKNTAALLDPNDLKLEFYEVFHKLEAEVTADFIIHNIYNEVY